KLVRMKDVLLRKVIQTTDLIFVFHAMSVSVWRLKRQRENKDKAQDLLVIRQPMVSTKMAMELVVLMTIVDRHRQLTKATNRISQSQRRKHRLRKKSVVFLKSFWVDRIRPLESANHLIAIRKSFFEFTFLINASQDHGLSFLEENHLT